MKKSIAHTLLAIAASSVLALGLAGCGGQTEPQPPAGDPAQAEPGIQAAEGQKTVGVIQFATHASLDDCYQGTIQGLHNAGFVQGENLVVDFRNAQADMSASDLMAKTMVSAGCDLIVAIATPSAMSAYAAVRDTDIPVVFCAVSDPMATGLVQSLEAPGVNCTGTSDVLNLEAQLKMIRAFLPEAVKIGVIYTTSEPNSISHLAQFEELAPQFGFEIVAQGVTSAAEVATAAASLVAGGVDCINNFTDNNVVESMSQVLHATDGAGIPLFGSEVQQVAAGCLASESIDYVELGRETGELAAAILNGADPAETSVRLISETTPIYNSAVLTRLGVALPEEYAGALDVAE